MRNIINIRCYEKIKIFIKKKKKLVREIKYNVVN